MEIGDVPIGVRALIRDANRFFVFSPYFSFVLFYILIRDRETLTIVIWESMAVVRARVATQPATN